MARLFVAASNQYLEYAGALGNPNVPLTMAAWLKPTSNTGNVLMLADSGVNGHGWRLVQSQIGGSDVRMIASSRAGGVTTSAQSSLNIYNSTDWIHVVGVFTSNTSRDCYTNGGNVGSDTTSNDPNETLLNRVEVGRALNGGYFSGSICDAAIWTAALNTNEILALYRGVRPQRIRSESLWLYWPILGIQDPEPEYTGDGWNLSLGASPTQANHAPVSLITRAIPNSFEPSFQRQYTILYNSVSTSQVHTRNFYEGY